MTKIKQRPQIIETIADFVTAMGGTGATARFLGVGDSYVSNMLARGYLPTGFHMRAFAEIRRQGWAFAPSFFGLEGDHAEVVMALVPVAPPDQSVSPGE